MKCAPAVRKSNSDKQERFELQKRSRGKVLMEEGHEAMTDKMIDRLICRRMWDSDRAWKTAKAVRDGVKSLKFKYEKVAALQDNIQMHYLGMSRDDAQTNWSKNNVAKTIPQYVDRLIEILKIYKGKKVPDEPESTMPARKQMPIVGTLTLKVQDLDREREGKLEGFNQGCRVEW